MKREEEEEILKKNNNFIQKVEHFGAKFQCYIGNTIIDSLLLFYPETDAERHWIWANKSGIKNERNATFIVLNSSRNVEQFDGQTQKQSIRGREEVVVLLENENQ